MAKKKRRSSGVRNLVILGLLLALFGGATVAIRFFQQEPAYIYEENVLERIRAREQENAYPALLSVVQALPAEDATIQPLLEELRNVVYTQPIPAGSVGTVLVFDGSESSSALAAYLELATPAVQLAGEALQKPVLDFPELPGLSEDAPQTFHRLGLVLLGQGAWHRHHGRIAEAAAAWNNAVRLARLIAPHDRWVMSGFALEKRVLAEYMFTAKNQQDVNALGLLQEGLERIGRPYEPKAQVLEQYWERVDISLRKPPSSEDVSFGRRIGMRFYMREVSTLAEFIRAHRTDFIERSAGLPREIGPWMQGELELNALDRGVFFMAHRMIDRLVAAYEVDAYFQGTRIVVALERFQRTRASFPAVLDELVPEFLQAVPNDPLAGAPFLYRLPGNYQLYSAGRDGADNGGDANNDFLIVM